MYSTLSSLLKNLIWRFHPTAVRGRRALAEHHNRHAGEQCVIIGNGPSLRAMDLRFLEHQTTFGLNRIYLKFPEWGFATSYFVSVNMLVLEQCAEEIQRLAIPRFVSWYGRDFFQDPGEVIFLRYKRDGSLGFARDPRMRLWTGATVTYVAMQLAYYLGFQTVYLIGVDHHFETKGTPHEIVTTLDSDPNHFDPQYFGKGFRWQLPDLERSEDAYRLAKKTFEQDGRRILDATVGGKLNIFPKIDYRDIHQEGI